MKLLSSLMAKPISDIRYRLGASIDLIWRYKLHFSYFWKQRKTITLPELSPHESEFLPANLSLQTRPVLPTGRLSAKILIIAFTLILTWSIFGKMDIVVNASGKIVPSQRTKIIDVLEPAKLKHIFVKEGQKVKAGDLLVELDTSTLTHERDRILAERDAARLSVARSRALINSLLTDHFKKIENVEGISMLRLLDAESQLQNQWNEYDTKRKRLNDEIVRFSELLPFITQRAKDYKELSLNRDVSIHAWMEKEQERAELEGKLGGSRSQLEILKYELLKNSEEVLNEALKHLAITSADVERINARLNLFQISSPIDGYIHQLSAHTVGGTATPNKSLMQIVPLDGQIEVEAFVENKDIGFVRVGQFVSIKIDTFDFTKYGIITGQITQISNDAMDSSAVTPAIGNNFPGRKDSVGSGGFKSNSSTYAVKVRLSQTALMVGDRFLDFLPGMGVSIEIKTGTRRIIEYVLSPLIKHTRESLNER